MNMMGVGPMELVVVLLVAFLVLGPDRMGSTARSLGKTVRDLQQTFSGIPKTLDELLEDPDKPSDDEADSTKGPGVPRPSRRRSVDDPPAQSDDAKE